MSHEALLDIIRREIQRAMDRRIRRMPCVVDGYNPAQHTVKVKLMPSGIVTGWLLIETGQIGLQIAPSVGDPGWLEFHEADRRAAVFVGANHNDLATPPKSIQPGEFYYQHKSGSSLYFKADGSVTIKDKGSAVIELDGSGNIVTTGNWTHNGDFAATGGVGAGIGGSDTVNLQTHRHPGVVSGGNNTGAPQAGT